MKAFIKFPLSAAALLILAACGGQGNGTGGDAGASPKDTPTAESSAAEAASPTAAVTKAADAQQEVATSVNSSAQQDPAPVAPISDQGVRGDVVLAVLAQLGQTGSSASPLQLPLESTSPSGGLFSITSFSQPLSYYSTLGLGRSMGLDTLFGRTSHSLVTEPDTNSSERPDPVTIKYGFNLLRNRNDLRHGDVIALGDTLKLSIDQDASDPNASTTDLKADAPARINWKKTYNDTTPLQTWRLTKNLIIYEARLRIGIAPNSDGKSFDFCEELNIRGEVIESSINPAYRHVCTTWAVPDNWKLPQKLQRRYTTATESRIRVIWHDIDQPDLSEGRIHWAEEGAYPAR